jgi:hypothetical protein
MVVDLSPNGVAHGDDLQKAVYVRREGLLNEECGTPSRRRLLLNASPRYAEAPTS